MVMLWILIGLWLRVAGEEGKDTTLSGKLAFKGDEKVLKYVVLAVISLLTVSGAEVARGCGGPSEIDGGCHKHSIYSLLIQDYLHIMQKKKKT